MGNKVPAFLLEKHASSVPPQGKGRLRMPFIEKGVHHLSSVIKAGYVQWETSSADHFFHRTDARVKVLFLLLFIIIISLKKDLMPEILIGVFVFLLVIASRLDVLTFYKKVLFFSFIFGFLITLPSAFNVITGGKVILPVLHLSRPHTFWIYSIPAEIGVTREGIYGVIIITSRVANSLALSFLVLFTTPFPEIIKALKVLKVPDTVLMIITLSYKYIFIFARTAEDMHLAKKSRLAGKVSDVDARRWIAGRIGVIFRKSQIRGEEIYKAMCSRGFSGEVRIYRHERLARQEILKALALFVSGLLFLLM